MPTRDPPTAKDWAEGEECRRGARGNEPRKERKPGGRKGLTVMGGPTATWPQEAQRLVGRRPSLLAPGCPPSSHPGCGDAHVTAQMVLLSLLSILMSHQFLSAVPQPLPEEGLGRALTPRPPGRVPGCSAAPPAHPACSESPPPGEGLREPVPRGCLIEAGAADALLGKLNRTIAHPARAPHLRGAATPEAPGCWHPGARHPPGQAGLGCDLT